MYKMILLLFIIGSISCICIESPDQEDKNIYKDQNGYAVLISLMCTSNTNSFEDTITNMRQATMNLYFKDKYGGDIEYSPEIIIHTNSTVNSLKTIAHNLITPRYQPYNIQNLYTDNEKVDCINPNIQETCLIKVDDSSNILPSFSRETKSGFHRVKTKNRNAICIQLEENFYVPLNKFPKSFGIDVVVNICKKETKYECACTHILFKPRLSQIETSYNSDKYYEFKIKEGMFQIAFHGMLYNFTKNSVKSMLVSEDSTYIHDSKDTDFNDRESINISYNSYMQKNLSVDKTTPRKTTTVSKKTTTVSKKTSTVSNEPTTVSNEPTTSSINNNSIHYEKYHWSSLECFIFAINVACDFVNILALIYIIYSIFNNYVKLEQTRSEYNLFRRA